MSIKVDAAKSRAQLEKKKADEATGEPRFDCISYSFNGYCRKLDALYCKTGKCNFCITVDEIFGKIRKEAANAQPPL